MKKLIVIIILFSAVAGAYCQPTTLTIGTGTATQKQPFGLYYGYERSAAVYTGLTASTFITSLGWSVGTSNPVSCPVKIYIKPAGSTSLTSSSWTTLKSGATLVFDGVLSFPSTDWQTVDIADYVLFGTRIIVLCETDYGGVGPATYPVFRYTYSDDAHEWWQGDDSTIVNASSGTVNANRPNIQITFTSLGNPVPPSGFIAVAQSSSRINLNWLGNASNDDVLVAYNTVNVFGTPAGSYVAGDNIEGGGTVIYKGPEMTFSHISGLSPGTTYYYKAWSVNEPGPVYSIESGSSATTLCDALSEFPQVENFESVTFPPSCWALSALPWLKADNASGYGSGSFSAFADFFHNSSGSFEIISPELVFGSLAPVTVTFDHAYATYSGQIDRLELWYSGDNGGSFNLLETWLGGYDGPLNTAGATTIPFTPAPDQWGTKSIVLPGGTDHVMFRGISGYGNNLFIDNITFSGTCTAPTMLVANNVTPTSAELTWTGSGPGGNWQVYWGPAGLDTLSGGTLVTGINSNLYLLEGLQSAQSYDFFVRTDCGSVISPWAGPVSFTTVCESVYVPFYENFDLLVPPGTGCHQVTDNNNDGIQWVTSDEHPASYPNSMFLAQNSSLAMDDWFFSPGVYLNEGVDYTVYFAYHGDGGGTQGMLELKWGSGPESEAMEGGLIWNDPDIRSGDYISGGGNVVPVATGIYYFGWHGYSPAGSGFLTVDDMAVIESLVSWNGSSSEDWDDPVNWTPGLVPNGFQHVTIPAGTPFSPVIYYPGPECMYLTIGTGASLTISPGAGITVNADILIHAGAGFNNEGLVIIKGDLDNQNTE